MTRARLFSIYACVRCIYDHFILPPSDSGVVRLNSMNMTRGRVISIPRSVGLNHHKGFRTPMCDDLAGDDSTCFRSRRTERESGQRQRRERATAGERQRRRFVPHRLRADEHGSPQPELHLRRNESAQLSDQHRRAVPSGPVQGPSGRSRNE